MIIAVKRDDEVIVATVEMATRPLSRAVGLLGRRSLAPGTGICLIPCGSIHTCFMRFPIDVVFFDRDRVVTRVARAVRPFRAALGGRAAHGALEVQAGWLAADAVKPGDQLEFAERGE